MRMADLSVGEATGKTVPNAFLVEPPRGLPSPWEGGGGEKNAKILYFCSMGFSGCLDPV